jgi:hypothetical protein
MINLQGLDEVLRLTNSSAIEVHYDVNYTQWDELGVTAKSVFNTYSSASTTTILTAFDGTQTIHRITVRNNGAGSTSVTIDKHNNDTSVTSRISETFNLDPNTILEYENFHGWKVTPINNVYVTTGGGGGGGITLYQLQTDANFSLVDGTAHELTNNLLTANRTVNVSGLTTEAEIYNGEQTFTLTFTGGTVYRSGGAITETEVMSGATTHLRKVGTKIFIIN